MPEKPETRKRRSKLLQEEVGSDSDISDYSSGPEVSDEDDDETPQQKRLRLAKSYLKELEEKQKDESEEKELDREALAHRLKDVWLYVSVRGLRYISTFLFIETVTKYRNTLLWKCFHI